MGRPQARKLIRDRMSSLPLPCGRTQQHIRILPQKAKMQLSGYMVAAIAGLLCARERHPEVAHLQPARRQEPGERNTELKKPGASPQGPHMAIRLQDLGVSAQILDSLNLTLSTHFDSAGEHRQPPRSAALASSSILGRIAYFRPTSMLNCTTSI